MSLTQKGEKKRIVLFASGSGTNAENIILHFKGSKKAEVVALLSNKKSATALERAKKLNVATYCFDREELYQSEHVLTLLKELRPDIIVLAGFLWIFPDRILEEFPEKVINLHPALLPKYGGKGMYGMNVHRAVIEQKEVETGISIHYVNAQYDEGEIIFQATTPVRSTDTAQDIADKIHQLEYKYFPVVIENLLFPKEHE